MIFTPENDSSSSGIIEHPCDQITRYIEETCLCVCHLSIRNLKRKCFKMRTYGMEMENKNENKMSFYLQAGK